MLDTVEELCDQAKAKHTNTYSAFAGSCFHCCAQEVRVYRNQPA